MKRQELQLLKKFEEDNKWFHENLNKLRKEKFTEKFVAIKNKKPIASNQKLDVVIKTIEKRGENPSYTFIEFVHPAGVTILL